MSIDKIIVTVIFLHFNKMKEKGRKIIPWFQTVAILSFLMVVLALLLTLILINLSGNFSAHIDETYFLVGFIACIIILFFVIKGYYFDSGKYISNIEEFTSRYSLKKQLKIKAFILTAVCIVPFLFIYCLYLIRG